MTEEIKRKPALAEEIKRKPTLTEEKKYPPALATEEKKHPPTLTTEEKKHPPTTTEEKNYPPTSAAKEHKRTTEIKIDGWQCEACTYIIESATGNALTECPICCTPRPLCWKCQRCTLVNKGKDNKCFACGWKNEDVEKFKVARHIDGSWNCPNCQADNVRTRKSCHACGITSERLDFVDDTGDVSPKSPYKEGKEEKKEKLIVICLPDGSWNCPICTANNQKLRSCCKFCEASSENYEIISGDEPSQRKTSVPLGTGACSICKVNPASEGDSCKTCHVDMSIALVFRIPLSRLQEGVRGKCLHCGGILSEFGGRFCYWCLVKYDEQKQKMLTGYRNCIKCGIVILANGDSLLCLVCEKKSKKALHRLEQTRYLTRPDEKEEKICKNCNKVRATRMDNELCSVCIMLLGTTDDSEKTERKKKENCRRCQKQPQQRGELCLDCDLEMNYLREKTIRPEVKCVACGSAAERQKKYCTSCEERFCKDWGTKVCKKCNKRLAQQEGICVTCSYDDLVEGIETKDSTTSSPTVSPTVSPSDSPTFFTPPGSPALAHKSIITEPPPLYAEECSSCIVCSNICPADKKFCTKCENESKEEKKEEEQGRLVGTVGSSEEKLCGGCAEPMLIPTEEEYCIACKFRSEMSKVDTKETSSTIGSSHSTSSLVCSLCRKNYKKIGGLCRWCHKNMEKTHKTCETCHVGYPVDDYCRLCNVEKPAQNLTKPAQIILNDIDEDLL